MQNWYSYLKVHQLYLIRQMIFVIKKFEPPVKRWKVIENHYFALKIIFTWLDILFSKHKHLLSLFGKKIYILKNSPAFRQWLMISTRILCAKMLSGEVRIPVGLPKKSQLITNQLESNISQQLFFVTYQYIPFFIPFLFSSTSPKLSVSPNFF